MRLFPGLHNRSLLTDGALFLILCGLFLAFQDVQWQLISMASFHAGIALTAVALLIHALRRHRAWRLELLVLAALGLLLMLAPALPLPFQDFLEYLIP